MSVEKSRAEIETTLTRYGATAFVYGWEGARALIEFKAKGRRIRFVLPLPERGERRFTHSRRGNSSFETLLSSDAGSKAWEQACRQTWRALALVIKAKLEAVATGIAEFEDEFLANIVLPEGDTVSQRIRPTIAIAYENNGSPPLLLDYVR